MKTETSVAGRLLQALLGLTMLLVIVLAGQTPAIAVVQDDDYPASWKSAPMDTVIDSWRYFNRECTSFVAYRVASRSGFAFPHHIGNANGWGYWARSHGYAVDMNPSPGAVAWWDFGSGKGHVAWVRSVSGNDVEIEEYNYSYDGKYHSRYVTKNSVSGYIHFKDLPSGPPAEWHLSFIKTKETGQGKVEVHKASKASAYRDYSSWATGMPAHDHSNGWFHMWDMNHDGRSDMVLIKTRNTGTGKVEIHWRDAATGFAAGHGTPTWLSTAEQNNGWFSIGDYEGDGHPDLFFVKTKYTTSGKIEVHWASSTSGYGSPHGYVTPLGTNEADNGWFQVEENSGDNRPELNFIKTRSSTGKVELHTIDGTCYCRFLVNLLTAFSTADQNDGWFMVKNVDDEGRADLVFVATKWTGSGKVEVHVAPSWRSYQEVKISHVSAFSTTEADRGWFWMSR